MLAVAGSGDFVDGLRRLADFANGYGARNAFEVREHDGATVFDTHHWDGGGGHPDALIAMLERAPADAAIVIAGKPAKPGKDGVASGVGWLRADDERVEAAVELDAISDAKAIELVTKLEAATVTEELACWNRSSGEWSATHDGAHVSIRIEIDVDGIPPLVECLRAK
jgi:hypothetical protein